MQLIGSVNLEHSTAMIFVVYSSYPKKPWAAATTLQQLPVCFHIQQITVGSAEIAPCVLQLSC